MPESAELTVVMSVRRRPRRPVENCLRSLARQSVRPQVIVVDYGSTSVTVAMLRELERTLGSFRLIPVTRQTELWCKPRALNIGLRGVKTKYTLFTDIDLMFSENFIELLLVKLREPKAFVLCEFDNLPHAEDNWERLMGGTLRGGRRPGAPGGCMATETGWFMKVRGFDEYYKGWGTEDDDLLIRAKQAGRQVVDLRASGPVGLWHQSHPTQKSLDLKFEELVSRNREYFNRPGKPLVRNPTGWGEL